MAANTIRSSVMLRLRMSGPRVLRDLIFLAGAAAILLTLGSVFRTTFEWDAVIRAEQAEEIVTLGLRWYVYSPHNVWLPAWQFLLTGVWLATGRNWPAVKVGEAISAVSAVLLAGYVWRFARVRGWNPYVAVAGLLASGTFVAYASQGMTDVLSTLLFFAATVYLLDYLEGTKPWSLLALTLVTSLNMLIRYEAWLFAAVMVLFLLGLSAARRSRRFFLGALGFGAVASFIVAGWLYYNYATTGSMLAFAQWVSGDNLHLTFSWFHSLTGTATQLLVVLTAATGVLWVLLLGSFLPWRESWQRLFGLLSVSYLIFYAYSLYAGYNSGWAREMLYLLPLSAVALSSLKLPNRLVICILLACAVVGVYSFSYYVSMAALYTGPCCP